MSRTEKDSEIKDSDLSHGAITAIKVFLRGRREKKKDERRRSKEKRNLPGVGE